MRQTYLSSETLLNNQTISITQVKYFFLQCQQVYIHMLHNKSYNPQLLLANEFSNVMLDKLYYNCWPFRNFDKFTPRGRMLGDAFPVRYV